MKRQFIKILSFLILILVLSGCEGVFEYSPYEAVVSASYKNTTQKNLDRIKAIAVNDTTFKFALISDSHYRYDDLKAALNSINSNREILFVIHCGDFTDLGLHLEYKVFHDVMSSLKVPYLTVIGNHDSRSNGAEIYGDMFGTHNYSFSFNNNKFILMDDIMWEADQRLDSNWLRNELSEEIKYDNRFVISHIPPFAKDFEALDENCYRYLMSDNKIQLSIHGHIHYYSYYEPYNDGIKYLLIPNIQKRSYVVVTVNKNSFIHKQVNY